MPMVAHRGQGRRSAMGFEILGVVGILGLLIVLAIGVTIYTLLTERQR